MIICDEIYLPSREGLVVLRCVNKKQSFDKLEKNILGRIRKINL
jgi:hypothetical protein